jgi:hypothetical protein
MDDEVDYPTTFTVHGGENTQDNVVEQLRALSPERHPQVKEVLLVDIPWSEAIVNECEMLFERYRDLPRWDWLAFYGLSDAEQARTTTNANANTNIHLHSMVESSLQHNRSRRYMFSGSTTASWMATMDPAVATAIACVMKDGIDLEAIRIDSFCIPNASMFQLSRTLVARHFPTRGPRCLAFRDIHFTEAYGYAYNGASEILATGLAGNSSLIELELFQTRLDDTRLSRLISALVGHPAVRQLNIGQTFLGPESLNALHQLLLSGKLSGLRFVTTLNAHHTNRGTTDETRLQHLLAHIPPSPYLKRLEFSFNYLDRSIAEDDVRFVLETVSSRWRQLESLNMEHHGVDSLPVEGLLGVRDDNNPSSFESFSSSLTSSQRSLLRKLYLGLNLPSNFRHCPPDHPLVAILLNLLTLFPRLGYIGKSPATHEGEDFYYNYTTTHYPDCIRHHMNMNRCGYYLLQGVDTVPLSLWPFIFAQTQRDTFVSSGMEYQANAIYHLLQSPTFQLALGLQMRDHQPHDNEPISDSIND